MFFFVQKFLHDKKIWKGTTAISTITTSLSFSTSLARLDALRFFALFRRFRDAMYSRKGPLSISVDTF